MSRDSNSLDRRHFMGRVMIVIGIVTLLTICLVVVGLAWTAMLTLFGGVLIGVLLHGLSSWVSGWSHIPRRLVLAVILLLSAGALVGGGFWLGPAFVERMSSFRARAISSWDTVHTWMQGTSWGPWMLDELSKIELSSVFSGKFGGLLSTTAGSLASLGLMVVFGIYFAISPDLYVRGLTWLAPPKSRPHVLELQASVAKALHSWLIGRFLSMLVVGLGTSIGLWLVDVPLAVPLGIFAGLLSFVPNVGPLLAAAPGILIGLSVDPMTGLWAALVYAGVQVLENYAITPLIQQRIVSVPPALLLGFQMLMGLSAGIVGLFMATPLLVTIIVLVQALYLREYLHDDITLIGESRDDEGEDPPASSAG